MPDWGVWLLAAIGGWSIVSVWAAFVLGAMFGRVSECRAQVTVPIGVADASAVDGHGRLHLVRPTV